MNRLNEIIPYILEGKCVLFIGAGLSKIAGCYDWDSVVEKMLGHELIRNELGIDEGNGNLGRRSGLSNEEIIEFCERKFYKNGKERDYWGIIRDAFFRNPEFYYKKYLPLVSKLKRIKPFPKIVTTNIDNCLEEAKLIEPNKVFYKEADLTIENLNDNDCGVFHIHGYIENIEDSLITSRKYLERYSKSDFKTFLGTLFREYSVLFLGYSLRDIGIKNIIQDALGDKLHFALVPEEDRFPTWDIPMYDELFRTKIIIYGPIDKFSDLLLGWIEKNFGGPELKEEG